MTTLDLAAAYAATDALLHEFGRSDAYMLSVTAWNHRHDGPQISVTVAVIIGHECIRAEADAFDAVLGLLRARLAQRYPIPAIVVTLPDAPVWGEKP